VREIRLDGLKTLPNAGLSTKIAYAHHVATQSYRAIAREMKLSFHVVRSDLLRFAGRCSSVPEVAPSSRPGILSLGGRVVPSAEGPSAEFEVRLKRRFEDRHETQEIAGPARLAMDDRQRQIREGAGQLESRLNQEFIEFLQKWSMPLLIVVALGAVGYAGWTRYKKAEVEKVNVAFQELESVTNSANPSPQSLSRVADEYERVRSVPHLARLAAADAYLKAVRLGVKPGSELKPDGSLSNPADALTEQDVVQNLNQANQLYQRVADDTAGKPGVAMLRVSAIYGLAAIAESRKLPDEAQKNYELIASITDGGPYESHAKVARARIASLKDLDSNIKLFSKAELPELPALPDLVTPPLESPKVDVLPAEGVAAPASDAPATEAPKAETPPVDATEPATPAPAPK